MTVSHFDSPASHTRLASPQGIIGAAVQLFFARRVKLLTGSTIAALFVAACAVGQACASPLLSRLGCLPF